MLISDDIRVLTASNLFFLCLFLFFLISFTFPFTALDRKLVKYVNADNCVFTIIPNFSFSSFFFLSVIRSPSLSPSSPFI